MVWQGLFYYISQDMSILQSKIKASSLRTNQNLPDKLILKKSADKVTSTNEDEISIDGRLYDITKIMLIKDSVYFYGFEDKGELEVINDLAEYFGNNNSSLSPISWKFAVHKMNAIGIDNLYTETPCRLLNPIIISSSLNNFIIVNYSQELLTIISPPPQV